MSFKLDLHVHTLSRGKVYIDESILRQAIVSRKIDGIAVTNFFDIEHARWLKEKLSDLVIIVGQEVWTKDGHIIALGVKQRIADFQEAQRTLEEIHAQGALAIAVHPFMFHGVKNKADDLSVDAIEVYNGLLGRLGIYNFLAQRVAVRRRLPGVAGDDTSSASLVGRSYTEVFADRQEDILSTIKAGAIRLQRRPLPLPWRFVAQNILGFQQVEPWAVHATPCMVCGRSWVLSFKKRVRICLCCQVSELSHIGCCQDHYYCEACLSKVGEAQARALRQKEYRT